MDDSRDFAKRMTAAAVALTGERFCTACHLHRKEVGGQFRYSGFRKFWVCRECLESRKRNRNGRR